MENAKYYDGKTSKPHECTAFIDNASIIISLEIGELKWPLSEIKYTEFQGVGKNSIQYGDFPFQTLEYFEKTDFAQALNSKLKKRREGFWAFANDLVNSGVKGAFILMICVFSALLCVYFYFLPYVAERIAENIPMEQEIQLGNTFYESMMKDMKIDYAKSQAVNDFAKNINFNTKYPIHFTVVKNDQINAFAIPGGEIVIFSKMLQELEKPENLVALMSHEANHILKKHSLKGMARDISGTLFLQVIFSGGAGFSEAIFSNAAGIVNLKYSRNLEKEADLQGLRLMKENMIDQNGMVGLMMKLQKEEEKMGMAIPQYLSTHPVSKNRIIYIKENINQKETPAANIKLNKTWENIKALN